jgi:hypothetical protein
MQYTRRDDESIREDSEAEGTRITSEPAQIKFIISGGQYIYLSDIFVDMPRLLPRFRL